MPRYTMDIGSDFEATLSELARQKQISKAEVIRRSVACYAFLIRELRKPGGHKVSITTTDDRIVKDVELP